MVDQEFNGQLMHAVEPVPVAYVLLEHVVHVVRPAIEAYVPGWHWAQAVATELEV